MAERAEASEAEVTITVAVSIVDGDLDVRASYHKQPPRSSRRWTRAELRESNWPLDDPWKEGGAAILRPTSLDRRTEKAQDMVVAVVRAALAKLVAELGGGLDRLPTDTDLTLLTNRAMGEVAEAIKVMASRGSVAR